MLEAVLIALTVAVVVLIVVEVRLTRSVRRLIVLFEAGGPSSDEPAAVGGGEQFRTLGSR